MINSDQTQHPNSSELWTIIERFSSVTPDIYGGSGDVVEIGKCEGRPRKNEFMIEREGMWFNVSHPSNVGYGK